jgi:hypothetical protein
MPKQGLIQTNAAVDVAGSAFDLAFNSSRFLALALLRGLFVKLATAQFRQDAGLLTSTLEAPQGGIEILVFSDSYAWQNFSPSPPLAGHWSEKTGVCAGWGRKYTVRTEEMQRLERFSQWDLRHH